MNYFCFQSLFSFASGRCVCCTYPTRNKLFEKAYAFICTECAQRIASTPQRIQSKHTSYHSIFVYGIYENLLQEIIPQYKYEAKLYYAPLLADILLLTIMSLITTPYTYYIPVPQHREKTRSRGFYHLGILVDYITRYTAIPNLKTYMRTTRNYSSQQMLSRKERMHNTKNAFSVQHTLDGACVLIIDDVITTGATINEVAQTLHNAGVAHIDCLSIAINKRGIL